MTEVLPLIYFTHAELKSKENIDAKFQYIDELGKGYKNSFAKSNSKAKKRLKLTINDENMSYEAVEEEEQPFMIGIY